MVENGFATPGQVADAPDSALVRATAEIITACWNRDRQLRRVVPAQPRTDDQNGYQGNGARSGAIVPSQAGPVDSYADYRTDEAQLWAPPADRRIFTPVDVPPEPELFGSTRSGRAPASPVTTPDVAAPDPEFADSVMSGLAMPQLPEIYERYPYQPATGPDALTSTVDQVLPQRVPAKPDVPDMLLPNDPVQESGSLPDRGELSRIAVYLRDQDQTPRQRVEGFNAAEVLAAVRSVPDVRDAQLRWNADSGHILRIDFVEGADAGAVTREVARLLRGILGVATPAGTQWPDNQWPENQWSEPWLPPPLRAPQPNPPTHREPPGPGATVVDHVQVTTHDGMATVEVRLALPGGHKVAGSANGPAADGHLLRLAASACTDAMERVLAEQRRSTQLRFSVEQVCQVPFPGGEVAVVMVVLADAQARAGRGG